MAERRDPDADRAVLQHHRWMGYQVSGGVFKRKCAEGFRRWLFGSFIADSWQVEAWFLVFAVLVFAIILGGVKNGVELMSKIMMPVLVVLAVIVAIYSMTRPGAMEGVKYFLIPNFKNFSWMTVVTAMGQMFYSLSIAMGILYTYGSYMHKKLDMEQSTTQVEIFDTGIAILAGLMIIPAVFAFPAEIRRLCRRGHR